jgi:beta-lactamase regulating signal transducer with metallopeptidase domain
MIETIIIPSCRAAVLIGGLFLLRHILGNRISPTMRHAFWGLVPLALLPLAISSPVSVYNLLPDLAGTPTVEQNRNLQIAEQRNPLGLHLRRE